MSTLFIVGVAGFVVLLLILAYGGNLFGGNSKKYNHQPGDPDAEINSNSQFTGSDQHMNPLLFQQGSQHSEVKEEGTPGNYEEGTEHSSTADSSADSYSSDSTSSDSGSSSDSSSSSDGGSSGSSD